jgi:hypothetical protein
MLAMETIIWLSFDDTIPVPALARPFALPRESVIDLFERGRELTQLQWTKNGVLIRPEDDVDWEEAEEIRTLEVEGAKYMRDGPELEPSLMDKLTGAAHRLDV